MFRNILKNIKMRLGFRVEEALYDSDKPPLDPFWKTKKFWYFVLGLLAITLLIALGLGLAAAITVATSGAGGGVGAIIVALLGTLLSHVASVGAVAVGALAIEGLNIAVGFIALGLTSVGLSTAFFFSCEKLKGFLFPKAANVNDTPSRSTVTTLWGVFHRSANSHYENEENETNSFGKGKPNWTSSVGAAISGFLFATDKPSSGQEEGTIPAPLPGPTYNGL